MFDFIRLLKLSGILLEEMTPNQARAVFKQYGASDEELIPHNLKKTRNSLAKKLHPDIGGDPEALKAVNAAYDVLAALPARPEPSTASTYSSGGSSGQPAWQTDSLSNFNTIGRKNYTDINYFKMRMWELSNRSKQKWTIWAFDGHYFRGVVTVFGNSSIFPEMAKAMIEWDHTNNVRAVFVQDEHDPAIALIWLDGKNISPPVRMDHDSPNRNPGNDMQFVRSLPITLDQISQGRD